MEIQTSYNPAGSTPEQNRNACVYSSKVGFKNLHNGAICKRQRRNNSQDYQQWCGHTVKLNSKENEGIAW